MGDMSHEPSMEEILSSIKKIIAEDGDKPVSVPRLRRAAPREAVAAVSAPVTEPEAADVDVLELTEAMNETPAETAQAPAPEANPMKSDESPILAEKSVTAPRDAFAQLTKAKTKPVVAAPTASDNAIEALVIEALRPMLKQWLDAHLPRIVESMVAKEIARLRDA